jgi:hypothetical protein
MSKIISRLGLGEPESANLFSILATDGGERWPEITITSYETLYLA